MRAYKPSLCVAGVVTRSSGNRCSFFLPSFLCSVRRVLKPVGRTSRSLQHVRFQSCSFVLSPGLRLEADQQRYSSRGERPSSSAGEQETISQQESRKHAAVQKTRRRKGWNLRGRSGPTRGLAHQVSKLSIANLVRLKQGSSLFLFQCLP